MLSVSFAASRFARVIPILLAICLMLPGSDGHAADLQAYSFSMVPSGDPLLDEALADSSNLKALRGSTPVGPYALIARAREDGERFLTVLRSFGYYHGQVNLRLDGMAMDDPDLPDRLARAPVTPPVPIEATVKTGPLFHLRKLMVKGALPPAVRAKLGLKPGDPATAPEVLAARGRLLDALKAEGYALAKVDEPVATLIPDGNAMDVEFSVTPGPAVNLGRIDLMGLKQMHADFLRRRIMLKTGDRFDPAVIEKNRREMVAIEAIGTVRTKLASELEADGQLPLTFEVTERPLHAVNLHAAYSTDLGASLGAAWKHRNLLGNAEQLSFAGGVTQLGGNSTRGIGYQATSNFTKPDFLRRNQNLQADLGAISQNLAAYDRKAVTADVLLSRRLGKHWNVDLGISLEQSRITQQGVQTDYSLIGLPGNLKYDNSDSLLDPTRGRRATFSVTPMQPFAGANIEPFVMLQASGSTYFDLARPGRSILALRGVIGDVEGATANRLPPDKRYYAGGSATVRGYAYQSVGPLFPDRKPRGGSTVAAGSLEFRQRILEKYGAAVFVDAGQVSESGRPLSGDWRFGAGLGARYYTGLGPIRLDVALPINKRSGDDSFEIYIGLGQAF